MLANQLRYRALHSVLVRQGRGWAAGWGPSAEPVLAHSPSSTCFPPPALTRGARFRVTFDPVVRG